MRHLAFLSILGVIIALLIPLAAVQPVHAALTQSDIDNAIREGLNYVLRSVAFIDSSWTKAVMRDHPSIPITLEWNGKYIIAGSSLDPGNKEYYQESFGYNSYGFSIRDYFNLDGDNDYDVIIRVTIRNIDQYRDQVTIYVEKCDLSNVRLIVGSDSRIINTIIYQGWSKTLTVPYYYSWHYSSRYVARHSTRIAAWLLEEYGYDEYAQALNNFMNSLGFQYDVYAPVFGKDVNYPDNFFDYYSTWLGNGYNAHPWIHDSSRSLYPYKSRIYIFYSAGAFDIALRGWKSAPLYYLLKALHLLNKYGTSRASEAESLIAKAMSDGALDGYGLKRAVIDVGYVLTGTPNGVKIAYSYKGYPIYLNAVFLATLVRYYQVTGDRYINGVDILHLADRLAGILIRAQWIYEHETPWGTMRLALYRGGWPAAYDIGYIVKPSAWGIIDTITSGWDTVAGILARLGVGISGVDIDNALLPMPSEYITIVNSESTILAIQALTLYKQLGRTPIDPGTVDIAPTGIFVGGGGYGYGSVNWGETSKDGTLIKATSYYGERYQYAKFKIHVPSSSNYNLVVKGVLSYAKTAGTTNTYAYVKMKVKIYDLSGNLIASREVTIDSSISYNTEEIVKTIDHLFSIGYLSQGTYIVEIGLHLITGPTADIDAGTYGTGHGFFLESVILTPYQ